jgi:hypothetical protein
MLLALTLAAAPMAAQGPLSARDLDGRAWTPLAPAAGGIHLLFFLSADCPISGRYAPEIDRIAAEYGQKGVRAWFIYADAALTSAGARENLKQFHPRASVPAIIDTGFTLTAAVNATVTPEAAVYTRAGLAYRGRIDDTYVTIGESRPGPVHRDLRAALDAVLAGRPVPNPETKAIGCFIERKIP